MSRVTSSGATVNSWIIFFSIAVVFSLFLSLLLVVARGKFMCLLVCIVFYLFL